MTELRIQMMRKDGQLRKEIVVAETASAIQLSVMWVKITFGSTLGSRAVG